MYSTDSCVRAVSVSVRPDGPLQQPRGKEASESARITLGPNGSHGTSPSALNLTRRWPASIYSCTSSRRRRRCPRARCHPCPRRLPSFGGRHLFPLRRSRHSAAAAGSRCLNGSDQLRSRHCVAMLFCATRTDCRAVRAWEARGMARRRYATSKNAGLEPATVLRLLLCSWPTPLYMPHCCC
jgi:hypothetical protein